MRLLSGRKKYVWLIALVPGYLLPLKVVAQDGKIDRDAAAARQFLTNVQRSYQAASYLGFRVRYRYTNAGKDARPMDSLSGGMQMDKGRCRLVIDGMETIVTGKYVIQVMPEDKTLYLSATGHVTAMDPVRQLDTVLAQLHGVRWDIGQENGLSILTLYFPPGGMYSSIRVAVDPATGYLRRITYGIHTAGLVGQEQVARPGHPAPYQPEGTIDMQFSDYGQGRFDDALFDEKQFFTHVAGRFEPAGRYRDYHIILTSSNL